MLQILSDCISFAYVNKEKCIHVILLNKLQKSSRNTVFKL